ncbi:MAG: hypothetical protein LBJ63_10860 [Prevotellaceae bacterium]|jgi:hypothetical protein|nr:hypothetical protein [Prevotellaceae bacterium]
MAKNQNQTNTEQTTVVDAENKTANANEQPEVNSEQNTVVNTNEQPEVNNEQAPVVNANEQPVKPDEAAKEIRKRTGANDVIAAIKAAEETVVKYAETRKAAGLNVSRILIIKKQLSELGKMLKPYA